MNAPVDAPQASPAAPETAPSAAPKHESFVAKLNLVGLAKSFSIGAVLVSLAGWLIHTYGSPAASSIWEEMLRPRMDNVIVDAIHRSPRIHDFMVGEINDYLSGKIVSREKPNEIGAKLKSLTDSPDKIENISNSLFGSVDSVYTVATDYSLEQIKDSAKNTLFVVPVEPTAGSVRIFVYADPAQHCVWAFLQAKGDLQRGARKERLNFTIKLNDILLRDGDNVPTFAQEIGRFIRKRQGTGGGGKDEEEDIVSSSLSANVQKVEIVPQFPAFDPIRIVGSPDNVPEKQPVVMSLTGYILITRRRTENRMTDCRPEQLQLGSVSGTR